jgi:virginiamycin B lyase
LNGLSKKLIVSHYENALGGEFKRLNAIASLLAAPVTSAVSRRQYGQLRTRRSMTRDWWAGLAILVGVAAWSGAASAVAAPRIEEFSVPQGSHPHDVAPAPDGTVWYTAQPFGELGRLDPSTGATRHVALGAGSRPHGVIVGPDGAAWITDGGLNAIVRVEPKTERLSVFPLPAGRDGADLNTATFDRAGRLWFTGQGGVYGRLDPKSGAMDVWDAPRGRGPYGICTTRRGDVYYVSLAGSYLAKVDPETGATTVLEPPTKNQGARRVWGDSKGRLWVSEWVAGKLALYDPATGAWREWTPPGANPRPYAVYVDESDGVWLADWGANAMVRFDPAREAFDAYPIPSAASNVRQLLGRKGEVWGAESGTDKLLVVRDVATR